MGKRRSRPRGAIRPTSYTGSSGQTFTADQVTAMLAAAQRGSDGSSSTPVAKMFGNAVPPEIAASAAAQQMTMASPFSPGEPLVPYDGFSRQPRTREFVPNVNIATRPRLHERVGFDTLKGLIRSYDIASIAIWHRIDSLRSVQYRLLPADGNTGDVSGAVELAQQVMRSPDRRRGFKSWFAAWMYDVLAYDAGALYRLRNRGGECIGLMPVSGPTIAPLLDYWGNPPEPPAEAYVQYVNGLPWNWLTRDDLIYEPFRAVNDSIYGQAPIESIILNANCYSDDTEVLTDRGWLRFAEVDISSDRFATRNPATAAFEWQSATRYHEADADGTMYRAASRNVDLLVTGGHRLLVDRLPKGCPGVRHGSEWLVHAEDLYEYQSALPGGGARVNCPVTSTWDAPDLEYFTLPVSPADFVRMDGDAVRVARASARFPACSLDITHSTLRRAERGDRLRRTSAEAIRDAYGLPPGVIREDAHYFSERIDGDDFAAFMGMYLSEGCVRADSSNISIAQEEYSKGYVEFRDLLTRMLGREAPYHRGAFTFGHTALADYLRPFGKADEKYIPREVLGMSRRQLEIFWHFYVLGDGAIYPTSELVSTCSKRLADGLQEVLQKIGSSGAVRPAGKPAKPTHHQRWQVQSRGKPVYRVNVEPVPYEGKVYCVSVPNKTLYVRRNGYPTWCANTDMRFQLYFLQRFTSGNIPEAFASAPESWSPDQIELWQNYWDSFMYGDQAAKHQIKWMPGGSTIAWSDEKDFTDAFSLFLMRKTVAAYHLVPTDLGFTDNANYSTGESQADVVHRVGELPLMEHSEEIFSRFLRDDLGLPVKFEWDRGEDQDDRATQAQADQTYIQSAVVSADEIREMRFGLPIDSTQPVPRIFFSERGGPIPLNAVLGVAGPNDPETASPSPGAPLPQMVFPGTPAVMDATVLQPPLAESEYGLSALPPAPPMQPMPPGQAPVGKEAAAGDSGSPGITAETGLYGDPLIGSDDEDDDRPAKVAKELAAFRRFARTRRKAGEWRDFRFDDTDAATARRLNAEGRESVRKDAVPGPTGGSGSISLDLPDGLISPLTGGLTDFHVTVVYLGSDLDDDAFAAACDRAAQAAASVPGPLEGTVSGVGAFPPSGSSDGKMPVWASVAIPGAVDIRESLEDLSASEHPGWTPHVTLAYLEPGDPLPAPLEPVPVTFACLSVHRGGEVVRFPLGAAPDDCCGAECCTDGCCNGTSGCTCGTTDAITDDAADVAKAASPPPKWPGWELDLPAAGYWGQQIAAAMSTALSEAEAIQIANAYLAAHPQPLQQGQKREAVAAAALWLSSQGINLAPALAPLMPGILADGYLIGAVSATTMTDGTKPDTGGWKPGNTQAAQDRAGALGLGTGLAGVLDVAPGAANSVIDGYMTALGRALVDAAAAGLTAKAAAAALLAVLADAAHATATALGQIVTAIGQAAAQLYRQRNVEYGIWVGVEDAKECSICLANSAAGRVKIGDPYPSGDTDSPAHNNCRCVVVPASAPDDAEEPEPVPDEPADTGQPPPFNPVQFATAGDAQDWLADHTPDLDETQTAAVKWYTGPGAHEANASLRSGTPLPDDIAGSVAALDSAMSPLPADMDLARIVELNAFPGTTDLTTLTGSEIADDAFASTSAGPPSGDMQGDVLMHIAAPEGSPGLITGTVSNLPKQREVVLPRGTRLAVTKVEAVDGNTARWAYSAQAWEMWLTVLPDDGANAVVKASAKDSAAQAFTDRMKDAVYTVVGTAPAWAMTWSGATASSN
jgi:ADP-ribosyltransferase exoenzyme/2'-5' RNA ligase superfamily